MQLEPTTAADLLRTFFLDKKKERPQYSVRAFARDLGMSQALMSLVLSGKRSLTLARATRIATLLQLNSAQSQLLLDLTLKHLPENSKLSKRMLRRLAPMRLVLQSGDGERITQLFRELRGDQFGVLSEWYFLALLDLTATKGFCSDPVWIAARLGIHAEEAKSAIHVLIQAGLLTRTADGQLRKTAQYLSIPTPKSRTAIRAYHLQLLQKAINALGQTSEEDFRVRSITSISLTVKRERIEEAKKRIAAFQKEMIDLFTTEVGDEVYQLNVQFFPMSGNTA